MTETEWLTSTDSRAMLDHLATANVRKLRQFACECLLRSPPRLEEEAAVVEVYQRYIDGEVSPTEWFETYSGAGGLRLGSRFQYLISTEAYEAARRMAGFSRGLSGFVAIPALGPVDRPEETALLRDIFGNPFHPVTFFPEWRTDTAVSLTRAMYESNNFSAMPILADALQDAGCDNDDLLNHCRDTKQIHVRGCWVVDLVLNKT